MNKPGSIILSVSALMIVLWVLGTFQPENSVNRVVAAEKATTKSTQKPVDDSMHEFMEYVFQPTYRRLKVAMATEEKDRAVWKAIKSDSMILAEGGNLLLMRTPDDDAADWNSHAVAVRELGGQLYRAAKKKDNTAVNKHYRAMLMKCNACHKQFENGKHILEP